MSDVLVAREGPVMVVTLNRPERHNAVGGSLMKDLADAFEAAAADDDVRVVVTTGSGSEFCVGADLDELATWIENPAIHVLNGTAVGGDKGLPTLSPGQERVERLGVGRWAERMLELDKPTIAALNGSAAGGGFALALLHDFRIASENAQITSGFIRLGVAPELGSSLLVTALLGYRVAVDLMLRGRTVGGEEAARIGLVDRAVPAGAVLEEAVALAHELAELPPTALQLTKRLIRRSTMAVMRDHLEAEYRSQVTLFDLPETRERIRSASARFRSRRS